MLGDQLVQCSTGAWTGEDDALILAVIDNFPALGVVISFTELFAKQGFQLPPSP